MDIFTIKAKYELVLEKYESVADELRDIGTILAHSEYDEFQGFSEEEVLEMYDSASYAKAEVEDLHGEILDLWCTLSQEED